MIRTGISRGPPRRADGAPGEGAAERRLLPQVRLTRPTGRTPTGAPYKQVAGREPAGAGSLARGPQTALSYADGPPALADGPSVRVGDTGFEPVTSSV